MYNVLNACKSQLLLSGAGVTCLSSDGFNQIGSLVFVCPWLWPPYRTASTMLCWWTFLDKHLGFLLPQHDYWIKV